MSEHVVERFTPKPRPEINLADAGTFVNVPYLNVIQEYQVNLVVSFFLEILCWQPAATCDFFLFLESNNANSNRLC